MRQTVRDYQAIVPLPHLAQVPRGDSASPREIVFHIFPDNSKEVSVLDIGFGEGILGKIIKSNPATAHWHVDGLDGWEPNCLNSDLFRKGYYRNVWHGLAQSASSDQLAGYQVICLLDVV